MIVSVKRLKYSQLVKTKANVVLLNLGLSRRLEISMETLNFIFLQKYCRGLLQLGKINHFLCVRLATQAGLR
jgi:hypothetical protein